jgi:hypothetical protein
MMYMPIVTYLNKAERGAINSGKDVTYFVTKVSVSPHTHPIYISRCIKEQAESLGLGIADGYYDSAVTAWSEDFDEIIERAEKQAAHYEPLKSSFPMQYHSAISTIARMKNAKHLIQEGLIVNAEIL